MTSSDYPWITIETVERRADLGWTRAECTLCGGSSLDNAEPYTEDWTHEHAQKCHPRWSVRRGLCHVCCTGSAVWVIRSSNGDDIACRTSHAEAMRYAAHKAALFLRGEIVASGAFI